MRGVISFMKNIKTFYERHLPHYQPIGYTFFVTFRLTDSLPLKVILQLKEERERELKIIAGYDNAKVKKEKYKEYQSKYFGKFDKLLDSSDYGPKWLKEDNVAQIVFDDILIRDKTEYDLIAFTIMPNHVHIVFTPVVGRDLSRPNENEKKVDINVDLQELNVSRDLSRLNGDINEIKVDINVDLQESIVTEILRKLKGSTANKCNKLLHRSGAFWQHESYDHVVRDKEELKRIVNYILNNSVKAGLCEKWEDWKYSYCNFELLV